MRVVVQRVARAAVHVDGVVVGEVGRGLAVLLGVGPGDDEAVARALVDKVVGMRIFEDAEGKTNLAATDVGAEVLVVSQFTL
jgi:D-tyrosyl-tRNA(Tyr) deacylase